MNSSKSNQLGKIAGLNEADFKINLVFKINSEFSFSRIDFNRIRLKR